jgi:myo-inositol-1(or 4)-monophosphatase
MAKAAEKAAIGLVRDFGELERLQVSKNGHSNFVTSADKNSESRIVYELSKARPEFSILSEESGFIENKDKDHVWIIDPIDGTNNFIRGIPSFAINIALMEKGKVMSGITLDPLRGDCFKAEFGNGAFVGNRNRLRVSGREQIAESVVSIYDGVKSEYDFMEEGAIVRRGGAIALDLAYLAAGKYDVVIAKGVSMWDIASGVILIQEAGGFIRYDKKDDGQYDVVATSSLKLLNILDLD